MWEDEIVVGDSLRLLRAMPSESVDAVFADPPFNLNKRYNSTNDKLSPADYLAWCNQWLAEVVRVTKPTGSIFVHNIPKWLIHYAAFLDEIATFKHWIVWNAPTAPMGKSLQPAHYGILYYVKDGASSKFYEIRRPHDRCRKCGYLLKDYGGKKKKLHPFGPLVSDVWTDIHRIRHSKHRNAHPCQLPVHLLERIVLLATDEGDVILDPFFGTGTTGVAAKQLGRHFVGFEIDPDYAQIARARLEEAAITQKANGAWVSIYRNRIVTLRDADWPNISHLFSLPDAPEAVDHTEAHWNGA